MQIKSWVGWKADWFRVGFRVWSSTGLPAPSQAGWPWASQPVGTRAVFSSTHWELWNCGSLWSFLLRMWPWFCGNFNKHLIWILSTIKLWIFKLIKSKLWKVLHCVCVAYAAIIAEMLKLVCSSTNKILNLNSVQVKAIWGQFSFWGEVLRVSWGNC